jgi:acyl-CoA reductase-like NAD-dependent aldehyde dehydrogenase
MAWFEANRGAEFIEACAAAAPQLKGEVLSLDAVAAGAGLIGMTRRVPFGVVAGVTPFNAPVNLLLQKVAPAVAVGNAIVVKPALAGTRVALRLAELFLSAGWPQGLFNVVTGDKDTAIALASHRDIAAISFTGGTAAGNDLARAAGARMFLAELGSNAANIVLADADLVLAASRIASAGFEASGQQCISAQRVLVDSAVLGEFLPRFVTAARPEGRSAIGRRDRHRAGGACGRRRARDGDGCRCGRAWCKAGADAGAKRRDHLAGDPDRGDPRFAAVERRGVRSDRVGDGVR